MKLHSIESYPFFVQKWIWKHNELRLLEYIVSQHSIEIKINPYSLDRIFGRIL